MAKTSKTASKGKPAKIPATTPKRTRRPGPRREKKGTPSAVLLGKFLEDHEMSMSEFGEAVGCTKSHVCGMVNGDTTPGLNLALAIEEFTRKHGGETGMVPVGRWKTTRAVA